MLRLSNITELRDHIFNGADKPFLNVTVKAPDETTAARFVAKEPEDLAAQLSAWLSAKPGLWILKFQRHSSDGAGYEAEYNPVAAGALQGIGDIESIISKRLEEERIKRENAELKAALQGQAAKSDIFVKALQPLLMAFAGKLGILPGTGPEASIQGTPGAKAHELGPNHRAKLIAATNKILSVAEPEFYFHLADWIEKNPGMIETVKQLTGYEAAKNETE